MPASTSPIAASLPITGMTLAVGTGASPETLNVIANMQDYNQAMKSIIVDVTNVGNNYVKRQPTVIDPGAPTFKIFWIPEETSHRNSAGGGTVSAGLRYLMIQKLLRDWVVQYPPDPNNNAPADAYKAFVTDFGITGKNKGVFEAQISLAINDDAPTFC